MRAVLTGDREILGLGYHGRDARALGPVQSAYAALARRQQDDAAADAARRAGTPAALALTAFVDDEKPLWADLGPDGRVTALGADARTRRYATCGLYYLTAAVARAMPPAQAHGRLREYLQSLVAQSAVAGVVLSKTLDVDRPEDVRQAESFVAAFRS